METHAQMVENLQFNDVEKSVLAQILFINLHILLTNVALRLFVP